MASGLKKLVADRVGAARYSSAARKNLAGKQPVDWAAKLAGEWILLLEGGMSGYG